jgi:hypothetical protein
MDEKPSRRTSGFVEHIPSDAGEFLGAPQALANGRWAALGEAEKNAGRPLSRRGVEQSRLFGRCRCH